MNGLNLVERKRADERSNSRNLHFCQGKRLAAVSFSQKSSQFGCPVKNSQKIIAALNEVESLYYRLVFLVEETESGKTTTLQHVSKQLGIQPININLVLSKRLLELTSKQRTLQLPRLLEDLVSDKGQTVILDNIEILFDVDLHQDPLRLLQQISRNRNIVVAWNGRVANNKLIYAEPGHPEYRSYNATDFLIVPTTRQEE